MYRLIFEGGGSLRATSDLDRMTDEIARLCPQDALQLPRLLADNRNKLEAFRPVLEMPFLSALALLKPHVIQALLAPPPSQHRPDLARYFSDHRIRLAFSFVSKIPRCRLISVQVCSRSWLFSSMSTASSIRAADAAR